MDESNAIENLDCIIAQATAQTKQAFARYDLEFLGGAVLGVRRAYLELNIPFPQFSDLFGTRAQATMQSFPPIIYDAGEGRRGIGLAFTSAFSTNSLDPFAQRHGGYVVPLPPGTPSKYTHALFVPLDTTDEPGISIEPGDVVVIPRNPYNDCSSPRQP